MAEAGAGLDIRRLLLFGGAGVVVVFAALFLVFRSCAPVVSGGSGLTVIYSNLELKDAANVIARLKEIAIPYEIRDNGRAIAVPKGKADDARLALAEKNLPAGGVVGWEIFDESKLGATDFDRRIQLIRAISGELSRTIRQIEGVNDVRVQIVIPETKLFAASVVPVTASVMLRLQPGMMLSTEKINGIVHLVASSVENLQTENVTVIDDTGRILTAKGLTTQALALIPETPLTPMTTTTTLPPSIVFATPEATREAKTVAVATPEATPEVKALTQEEKVLLRVQAKKELERDLAGKAQEILNRLYPPNSAIIKVNIDMKGMYKDRADLKSGQIIAVILIDNRLALKKPLKEATFKSVAAAIGYNKKRGDRIVIQKVPFHLATVNGGAKPSVEAARVSARTGRNFGWLFEYWWLVAVFAGLALLLIVWRRFRGGEELKPPPASTAEPVSPQLEGLRGFAERNPEKIAELLRSWLTK